MSEENLFKDFSATSLEAWRKKIEKDLKGKDYDSLKTHTAEGITIEPAYNSENSHIKDQPFKAMAKWDVVQELLVEDAHSANKQALDHLNRGATSLLFYLYSHIDLEVLLKDIKIEYIRSNFVVEGDALALAENLKKLISKRGLKEVEIAGSINIDCLENLARTGHWITDEDSDFENLGKLLHTVPANIKSLCVNANLFGNAGATLGQQIGIALSMVYEYVHHLQLASSEPFWINFAIGSDYFGEIAKLRAWRRVWSQFLSELDLPQSEAFIYAETTLRNKTIKDAYNNMVRTTSEGMAAAIGGANEISIKGFNHTFKEPDFFGERIAKNQQSILEYESHFREVADMAKGSYFIEELTEELAHKGWDLFKKIESKGGFIEALKEGWLQEEVEQSAGDEQKAFDEKQKALIGANKYARADENLKEIIEHGMFSDSLKPTTDIKRIIPTRLSEKLEK